MNDTLRWLEMAADPSVSPRDYKLRRLNPTQVLDLQEPASVPSGNPSERLKPILAWAARTGNHLLVLGDPAYPALLKEIDDPPKMLFCRGNLELLQRPMVAVVGTRHPSVSGQRESRDLSSSLAALNIAVVSGLAMGIDALSHEAALSQEGKTVAVLGCGIDRCYPVRHQKLFALIEQQGLILSEYPPGTPPRAWQFPVRNRIISGLSLGVVVVEAALKSGSLITARLALEHNREVFAMPGLVRNEQARGCHQLIRQGAKLVETVSDIIEELPLILEPVKESALPAAPDIEVTAGSRDLIRLLDWEVQSTQSLAQRSGLSVADVTAAMMELVLAGVAEEAEKGFLLTPRRTSCEDGVY